MNKHTYFYFYISDTGGLIAYRKRSDEMVPSVYTCRGTSGVNPVGLYGFVSDLTVDAEEGYLPISFDSQVRGMEFIVNNIPRPADGVLLAFNHVDLKFLILMNLSKGAVITSYNFPLTAGDDVATGYAMLDYIQQLVAGTIQVIGKSEWVDHIAYRVSPDKNFTPAEMEHFTVAMQLPELLTMGQAFVRLQKNVVNTLRNNRYLAVYFKWMLAFTQEMEEIITEDDTD